MKLCSCQLLMGASSAPTTPTRARAAWPHTHSTYTRESPGREGSGQSQARESEVASEGGGVPRRERKELGLRGERCHSVEYESAIRAARKQRPTDSAHRTRESGSGREKREMPRRARHRVERKRESERAYKPAERLLRHRIRDVVEWKGRGKASHRSALVDKGR